MFVGFFKIGLYRDPGRWANECPPSPCWVSWEKIKTYTIYTPCEAEGACFPRIGPTLSSTLGGPLSPKANCLGLYPTRRIPGQMLWSFLGC